MSHDDITTQILPEHKDRGGATLHPPGGTAYKTLPMLPGSNLPAHPTFGKGKAHRTSPQIHPLVLRPHNHPMVHLPHRPIYLVELCGGIAIELEAVLKARHAVAAYTWADIDLDAHTATTHRLAGLHSRHPLLLPRRLDRKKKSGYNTR